MAWEALQTVQVMARFWEALENSQLHLRSVIAVQLLKSDSARAATRAKLPVSCVSVSVSVSVCVCV